MVIRPKSMATVVVSLPGTLDGSSMPDTGRGHHRLGGQRSDLGDRADQRRLADAEAAGNDDLRGGDPPGGAPRRGQSLRSPLSTLSKQFHPLLVRFRGSGTVQRQQAVGDHVGDQHPGDTQRKPGVRGDLRQRLRRGPRRQWRCGTCHARRTGTRRPPPGSPTSTASSAMSWRGSVRPRVTAYGRTSAPRGSSRRWGCPCCGHLLPVGCGATDIRPWSDRARRRATASRGNGTSAAPTRSTSSAIS